MKNFIRRFFGKGSEKKERYPVFRTTCGAWVVEINNPAGIMVKHTEKKREYHFAAKSNGWISAIDKSDEKNHLVTVLEVKGLIRDGQAVLVDEESNQKYKRFYMLRDKAKNGGLTREEQKELLSVLGI